MKKSAISRQRVVAALFKGIIITFDCIGLFEG